MNPKTLSITLLPINDGSVTVKFRTNSNSIRWLSRTNPIVTYPYYSQVVALYISLIFASALEVFLLVSYLLSTGFADIPNSRIFSMISRFERSGSFIELAIL